MRKYIDQRLSSNIRKMPALSKSTRSDPYCGLSSGSLQSWEWEWGRGAGCLHPHTQKFNMSPESGCTDLGQREVCWVRSRGPSKRRRCSCSVPGHGWSRICRIWHAGSLINAVFEEFGSNVKTDQIWLSFCRVWRGLSNHSNRRKPLVLWLSLPKAKHVTSALRLPVVSVFFEHGPTKRTRGPRWSHLPSG